MRRREFKVANGCCDILRQKRWWSLIAPALLLLLLGGASGVFWCRSALAADSPPAKENFVQQILGIQETLLNLNQRIEKETLLAQQAPPAQRADRHRNVGILRQIRDTDQHRMNVLKKISSLADQTADLKKKIADGRAFALNRKKPYALDYYDGRLDAVAAVRQEQEVLSASLKDAASALDQSRQTLETASQTWRRVKEEVESAKGAAAPSDPRYVEAQLKREAARAGVDLQQLNREVLEREIGLENLKEKVAEQKLKAVRQHLAFDQASLDREIARVDAQKGHLDQRLQPILRMQNEVEGAWARDRATAGGSASDEAQKAQDAWRETYQAALQQTEEMNRWLDSQEKLWKSRYALLQGKVSQKDLDRWGDEATAVQRQVRQAIELFQSRQVTLQSRITSLEKDQGALGTTAEKYLAYRLDALKKNREIGNAYLSTILATGQLSSRLLDEVAARAKKVPFWEKAWAKVAKLKNFWNLELWVVDGNGVTVRKVVTAIIILILGFLIVKRLIRMLSRRLKRANVEMSAAAAAEKLLLYVGFLLVILFALHTVNIPLTAFTFLGGAVAIGVGFGAQNLINNFISGFMIMAERPIRIGDLIEVEGKCARVEEIGARCTRIKTGENIHLLVPNSTFLEKSITNWTLSDKMVRSKVVVGVAYGSPVRKVTDLLLEAVAGCELVLAEPKPFVIFEDFGDNALTFEIYFWGMVREVMERKRIASNVRYRIDELFAQHGIVIAFPQRDLHLDSLAPVQVRLLPAAPGGGAPGREE